MGLPVEFPEVDGEEWKIIGEEVYWCNFSGGIQRPIGLRISKQRVNNPREQILELNIYWKGIIGRIWHTEIDKNWYITAAQILKDQNWITGLRGEGIKFFELTVNNQYRGLVLKLAIEQNKPPIELTVLRDKR